MLTVLLRQIRAPAGVRHHSKRLLQTQTGRASDWQLQTAIAFDIDGVLVKGKQALDQGRRALAMLNGHNRLGKKIPFVLLTNGGGVSEAAKAADISKRMQTEIRADQVVLAHSPMQSLVEQYADKHVLVVGGIKRRCADIARAYGFANVSTPNDLVHWRPSLWPFMRPPADDQLSAVPGRDYAAHPFHAVMVFHDSFDFGRDLQAVTDILRSRDATAGNEFVDRQVVPLYMSNEDLVFSNDYPQPRFGQGAYHVCLRAMWQALTNGAPLEYTRFGKPHGVQYRYAEQLLDRMASAAVPGVDLASMRAGRRIFAIGDNPAADIAGANGAGWTSVLVRTGVFRGPPGTNDAANPAAMVVDHVEDAVGWILDEEARRLKADAV
ncbi:hypothetical protein H4R99_003864 [Coemansia sp. RSA 1722]|nr:hypothetical protein LPJ57_007081 [Coemansia sp. RSA 486]KAJ2226576.1 hypothetical protein IWW45_007404 [Coemansia sp. RSA 485]KAJ2599048.1 hypothetical protein H4R99_003864 [Coemansia sp. RSA 1722]